MNSEETLRAAFERANSDSYKFRRGPRGGYTNPVVARDWKWCKFGAAQAVEASSQVQLSSDRFAVVDLNLKWIPIAREKPPQGAKLLLIDKHYGVATLGSWSPNSNWTHWYPLPTFDHGNEQETP